jgi:4-amino-4-deoxy-L-arabinose transferase-like glycosyltransferase
LPISLVQSITTQNDYVTALWTLCAACFFLLLIRQPTNRIYMLGVGLSLGLGTLTKSTTLIYTGPMVLCAGGWLFFKAPAAKNRLRLLTITGLCFFVLNTPYFLRNYLLMGSPLGSARMVSIITNAKIEPAGIASNLIRNLALNTNTGIKPLTGWLNSALSFLHEFTGRDLNDPATTYYSGRFQFIDKFLLNDSYASNPWHLFLLLVAAGLLAFNLRQNRRLLIYACIFFSSVVLFCAYLRWQQWHTRMHLTYFLLFIPWAAVLLIDKCPKWALGLAASFLVLTTGHCVLNNASRPIFKPEFVSAPREQQHLAVHGRKRGAEMSRIADAIVTARCQTVGLKLQGEDPEYGLWLMLRNRGFKGAIHHYFVEHESSRIPNVYPQPDVLVTSYEVFPPNVTNSFPHPQQFGHFKLLWPAAKSF